CVGCDGNLLRAELVNLHPVQTLHRVAHRGSLDFLRDSSALKIDFRSMRGWLASCHLGSSGALKNAGSSFGEFCSRVLLSWTFYRGMVMQMIGAAVQHRYDVAQKTSAAAAAFLERFSEQLQTARRDAPPKPKKKKKSKKKKAAAEEEAH